MLNKTPLWYKDAIFYELYVRAFRDSTGDGKGDLQGVIEKLDYLQDLGINCVWLLPIFPSPLKDDGYDVANFRDVHSDYGTLEDFKELIREAHKRGIRVITDLVLNHTSDQHPWFQAARKDPDSPYRDYYVWSETTDRYSEARIIFVDTEESNWAWDEVAGMYYWHRFFSSQPDLNYDNPAVQQEMLDTMEFWLELGIDGFRADAIPYLFERDSTNCENLPETHEFLKRARHLLDLNYPDGILLSEANQWPEDVRPYFGEGDEVQMAFHFPVMPRIFMALKQQAVAPIKHILARTPDIPDNCQWCVFLRNHDELTLEMVTEQERQWMWEQYAPEDRMRLNLGIRRRLAPLLDNDPRMIALANSLLFTLAGSPILYYGDEIGMGDNILLPDRDGVRTPMQWNAEGNAGFSKAKASKLYSPLIDQKPYTPEQVNVAAQRKAPESLYNLVKHMIQVRKANKPFGWGDFQWARGTGVRKVASYWREYEGELILVLNNLMDAPQKLNIQVADHGIKKAPKALLHNPKVGAIKGERLEIELEPFEFVWLKFH